MNLPTFCSQSVLDLGDEQKQGIGQYINLLVLVASGRRENFHAIVLI